MLDILFDAETLGDGNDAIVLDLSVIVFDPDPLLYKDERIFNKLVSSGKQFKLSVKDQVRLGRTKSQGTLDWWSKQSDEAKEVLRPLPTDLTLVDAMTQFIQYLNDMGIHKKESQIWCRGNSFDLPILKSLLSMAFPDEDYVMPVMYRNERDIRTAIESLLLTRGMTVTPLPKGILDGFIHHNSLHDCAKDIIMLQYARLYALGEIEPPEDIDSSDSSSIMNY